jgi:hypothetical protein
LNLKGLSNYLNLRGTYILLDYSESTSLPVSYDTDLENFWTQKSTILIILYFKISVDDLCSQRKSKIFSKKSSSLIRKPEIPFNLQNI